MSEQKRTTVVLPQTLLDQVKLYALVNKTSVSEIIRACLDEKIRGRLQGKKKSVLDLAGRLNLDSEPPTRKEIYQKHVSDKNSL